MRLIILFFLLLNLFACKNKSSTVANDLPKDFVAFYERFHKDSIYQLEHIVFPLEGIPENVQEYNSVDTVFTWAKYSWKIHHPFQLDDNIKQEIYSLDSNIVVDRITLLNNSYGLERRFSKMGKEWYLIYYIGMNKMTMPETKDTIAPNKSQ